MCAPCQEYARKGGTHGVVENEYKHKRSRFRCEHLVQWQGETPDHKPRAEQIGKQKRRKHRTGNENARADGADEPANRYPLTEVHRCEMHFRHANPHDTHDGNDAHFAREPNIGDNVIKKAEPRPHGACKECEPHGAAELLIARAQEDEDHERRREERRDAYADFLNMGGVELKSHPPYSITSNGLSLLESADFIPQ